MADFTIKYKQTASVSPGLCTSVTDYWNGSTWTELSCTALTTQVSTLTVKLPDDALSTTTLQLRTRTWKWDGKIGSGSGMYYEGKVIWYLLDEKSNSNSTIKDGIEYYMETDKHTYHLGEDIEMLYRVTNLRDEDVTFSFGNPLQYNFLISDETSGLIWGYYLHSSECAFCRVPSGFSLQPDEFKEFNVIWDMINDNGTHEESDDFTIQPGNYNITGILWCAGCITDETVPVSMPIKIIPPPAITYYVNPGQSIQAVIDNPAVVDGDEIIVLEGTYVENINFNGKNIILRSTDPNNLDVVVNTIIDGNDNGSVVTFAGTESPACVLTGFTITNGSGSLGIGVCGQGTLATIEYNKITQNMADWDHCSDGGGGLSDCDGLIRNNIISQNIAFEGGGLYKCDGTILNNVIFGNQAHPFMCMVLVNGSGLYDCDGTIQNNVIYANPMAEGLYGCDGLITNNIIWANWGPQLSYCTIPTYSCIQNWTVGGIGNIDANPLFADPNNDDFHLLLGSPCINAGDPCYIAEPDETDLDGNPRVIGGRIDMGAYEVTPLDLLLELSENIDAMGLPKGIANSLLAKLDTALEKLEDDNENNDAAAINLLEAFIKTVEAQYSKKIPKANADALIEAAQEIIDLLSNR